MVSIQTLPAEQTPPTAISSAPFPPSLRRRAWRATSGCAMSERRTVV